MASENSFGDDAGQRVAGSEERLADLRVVADDHGDGHGFAERAAEAENDRADDADARVAQNADADHLPARGAERQHRLALRVGHGRHDVAGERGDDGQDHDGEDDARGQQPTPKLGPSKRPVQPRVLTRNGSDVVAQSGTRTKTAHSP